MAKHNVVIKSQVAAMNIDAWTRTAVCEQDVDNGAVLALKEYSDDPAEGMVWKGEQATATSKHLWMVVTPEVVSTELLDGQYARNLVVDPRAFVNRAGSMLDVFLMHYGDIIEMTGEGITGIGTAANKYLVPDTTGFKLKAATAAGTGTALRKVGTGRLHIGDASFVKAPVLTYKFEVEEN